MAPPVPPMRVVVHAPRAPRGGSRGLCCWSLPPAIPKLTLPEVFLLLAKARPVTTLCLTVCGTACRSTAAPLPLRSSQEARFYPKVRESLPSWASNQPAESRLCQLTSAEGINASLLSTPFPRRAPQTY